jgi:hypothetical protein
MHHVYIATFRGLNLLILANNASIKIATIGCIMYNLNDKFLLRLPPVTVESFSPRTIHGAQIGN